MSFIERSWALLMLLALGVSAEEKLPTLVVHATGFHDAQGQAMARLYRAGEDVVGVPWRTMRAPVTEGKALLVFEGVPAGRLAVVVVHDRNANGAIDHNLLHLPAEPLGFSNGFKLGVFSGKPTFEKLGFELAPDGGAIDIEVR